jgi:glutaredoxin
MKNIVIYGADWCADCKRSKEFLASQSIDFEYINIEEVEGASDEVAKLNDGLKRIPTILFPDGSVLVEPTNLELKNHLAKVSL